MFLAVYYPRRSQKSMGAMGRKISSFLLTQYTDNYFGIYQNNIIKIWDKIIFLEFTFIILLIGQIFLMSSSDFFSIFISIKLQSYDLDVLKHYIEIINSLLQRGYQVCSFGWYPFLLCSIIPIKIYSNTEADKDTILSDNKNKSGIYMWKNTINEKQYIGSAVDLFNRLSFYYSCKAMKNLLKKSQSHICSALLKYGHDKFSLTILEYCKKEICVEREDFYLSTEKHEYNILEKAGSSKGRKHSDKSKKIISEAKKGQARPEGAGKPSQVIEVTDIKTNKTTTYDSIHEATRALQIYNHKIISNYFLRNQKKPYKGRYTFKKV